MPTVQLSKWKPRLPTPWPATRGRARNWCETSTTPVRSILRSSPYGFRRIRAQLALGRKNTAEALDQIQTALHPTEYGMIPFADNFSCLYTAYIRGEANLAAGQGTVRVQRRR
jgi:hypothetical protein